MTNLIAGTGGLNVSSGTVIMSNNVVSLGTANTLPAAAYIGSNTTDSGTLVFAGNAVATGTGNGNTGGGLQIGYRGLGVLVIKDNAVVNDRLVVGNIAGSAGAVYQLGGVLNNNSGSGNDGGLGSPSNAGANSYGYYGLYSGTWSNPSYVQIGANGNGVVYNLGGTITATGGNGFEIGRGGTAVVYFANSSTLTSTLSLQMGGASGNATGLGVLTLTNNAQVNLAANSVLMVDKGTQTEILNLNGGTLTAFQISKAVASGLAIVNFNGGTLRAGNNGTLFNTGANSPDHRQRVRRRRQHRHHQQRHHRRTCSHQPAAAWSASLSAAGTGYIGAPVVHITGGSGTGATAIAQIIHHRRHHQHPHHQPRHRLHHFPQRLPQRRRQQHQHSSRCRRYTRPQHLRWPHQIRPRHARPLRHEQLHRRHHH